jgi:hypothetical protein
VDSSLFCGKTWYNKNIKIKNKKMENEIKFKPDEPASKYKIKLLLTVGICTIITASIVCYVFLSWQNSNLEMQQVKNQQKLANLHSKKGIGTKTNISSTTVPIPDNFQSDESVQESMQIGMSQITVEWNDKIKKVKENCGETDVSCYLVGKIIDDDPVYKNKSFYLEETSGMGSSFRHYVLMETVEGNVYKEYAESDSGENDIPISGISDLPDEITYPNTNFRLKKYYSPSSFFSDISIKNKSFDNRDLGDIYLTESGCAVAQLPDQTALGYDLIIPFVSEGNPVIDITLNDGKKNKEEYEYTEHSCAAVCTGLLTIDENVLKPDERLEVAGKTVNGDNILRIKDPNDKYLKDLYNDKNTIAYYGDDWQNQNSKSKYSYDEFIKLNPYLYWKDPFGQWVEFKNSKFVQAAEMCKPVIYLYPREKAVLGVKVSPNGGFTKTEPAYNGGWQVEASPDGKLRNLVDGNLYDSLLWEGIGLKYPVSKRGWVVGKDEIGQFLDEKLETLGLNEKEASDFKEYWLERLNEKPFYQISFLTRNQFDSLAPLEFYPLNPDTLIRIMMTARGLDNYQDIPLEILPKTPARNGFTAVEWGGTLLK